MISPRRGLASVLALTTMLACESPSALPPPAPVALTYSTKMVLIPACQIVIPPVRDDLSGCSPDEIGGTIRPEAVCVSLKMLKAWMQTNPLPVEDMQPGDWTRVRAITVCRTPEVRRSGEVPTTDSTRWRVTVEART